MGNGTVQTRTLDADQRLQTITVTGTLGTLSSLDLDWTNVDTISALNDPLRPTFTQSFTHDNLDRLSGATGSYGTQAYQYDANGNRLRRTTTTTTTSTQTLTYTTGTNRLSRIGSQAVVHDAAGNRTSQKGTYTYNAMGQRTRKMVPVTGSQREDHFIFDQGGNLLAERTLNPSGTSSWVEYVYLDDIPVARNLRNVNAAGATTSQRLIYLHGDQLNTPRLATDATQRVVWRRDSDPFGVGGLNQNPDGDGISEVVNLRFPGQYFDAEADLVYNYFRDSDRNTGRYTQGDPMGLGGGINRYIYASAKPGIYFDPLGLADVGYPTFPEGRIGKCIHEDCGSRPASYNKNAPAPPTPCEVKCLLPDLRDVGIYVGVKAAARASGELAGYAASRAAFVYGVYSTSECIDRCKKEGTCLVATP